MEYKEYTPHPLLAPYIECYWSALADSPPFQHTEALIPDGSIELMFNFGDPYYHVEKEERQLVRGSHIIGIRKQSLFISQSNYQNFFSVRFRLGGTYPFWGIPAYQFSDTFSSIGELLGADYGILEEQLYDSPSNLSRVALLDQFFLQKLNDSHRVMQTMDRFFQACNEIDPPNIAHISQHLGIGYKKIERHLKEATGLTPQQFLKIRRFNTAVKSLYSGQYASLTEVAYAAGYFDQAHCIRDFRSLTGQTPKGFLQSQFKIVEVIQPALADRLAKMWGEM